MCRGDSGFRVLVGASLFVGLVVLLITGGPLWGQAVAGAQKTAASEKTAVAPDSLTLVNGDVLTGRVSKVVYGNVTFHDEVLGDLTIPVSKIRTMHTTTAFAAGAVTQKLTKKNIAERVPLGPVKLEGETLSVMLPEEKVRELPVKDLAFMLDEAAYTRELHDQSAFFYGWYGSATVGATLVNATNSSQTYTGAVALVRAIPTIAGLPAGSKTILNVSGTYGLARAPEIISGGTVYQTAAVTKTNILHGDLEYDKFFSPMVFGLLNASADHNFGSGLELQQAYGAGIGLAILRTPQNDLSVRASLQYARQQFYNGITSGLGTPNENLSSASLGETWSRLFPHGIRFNESVTLNPAFNVVQAYNGVGSAGFTFPFYKRLNFSVMATDNYLGNPSEGFKRNSLQFTTGVTYTLK